MPEFIWVAIPMFLFFTWFQGWRMGLHDTVPRDPGRRVKGYASAVLSLLKDELSGQRLLLVEERRVELAQGQLWVESGQLCLVRQGRRTELPLGAAGRLSFQRQGSQLLVSVTTAEPGGPQHSLQVYLPVRD